MNDITERIILETRENAYEVLSELRYLIHIKGVATVIDFYSLCGITGRYGDDGKGWKDLSHAEIRQTKEGFFINLPKFEEIEQVS